MINHGIHGAHGWGGKGREKAQRAQRAQNMLPTGSAQFMTKETAR